MNNKNIISAQEFGKKYNTDDVARLAHFLLVDQMSEWDLPGRNYKGLKNVQIRNFSFDKFNIFAQFNPERIRSSAAKTDKKSIEERPCFLCSHNLPPEQKGLLYRDDFIILVNPFPIFQEHFTIPHVEHTPQRIKGNFRAMLDLSRDLHHYVVFYNGPQCGASAPDHFHFQAGIKGFMPVDYEYPQLKSQMETVYESGEIGIYGMGSGNYMRQFIAMESNHTTMLTNAFNILYDKLAEWPYEEEPMLNILAGYWEDHWRILVFPRKKHRPEEYYLEGDNNLLISPASVDFGGTLITPQQKDFDKINKADIADLFRQVASSEEGYNELIRDLNARFKNELK